MMNSSLVAAADFRVTQGDETTEIGAVRIGLPVLHRDCGKAYSRPYRSTVSRLRYGAAIAVASWESGYLQRLRSFVEDGDIAVVGEHPPAPPTGELTQDAEVDQGIDGSCGRRVGDAGLSCESVHVGPWTTPQGIEYSQRTGGGTADTSDTFRIALKQGQQPLGGVHRAGSRLAVDLRFSRVSCSHRRK